VNFRKHINIVLATLILLANLSLSFSVHYCNDEIAAISFQFQNDETCIEEETACCVKQDTHDACCSDKYIQVENTTDDVLVKTFQFHLQPAVLNAVWIPNLIINASEALTSTAAFCYFDSHAPPLYKLYCQLVLYA
jgi:hypothetical protein